MPADFQNLAAVAQTAFEESAQREVSQEAKNAYEFSQKQFASGLIDIDTVLSAERALFSANDALIQAKLSHLHALISLAKALGGGWRN